MFLHLGPSALFWERAPPPCHFLARRDLQLSADHFDYTSQLQGTLPNAAALFWFFLRSRHQTFQGVQTIPPPDELPVVAVTFFLSVVFCWPRFPEAGCFLLGGLGSPDSSARKLFSSASSPSSNFASLRFLSFVAARFSVPPRTLVTCAPQIRSAFSQGRKWFLCHHRGPLTGNNVRLCAHKVSKGSQGCRVTHTHLIHISRTLPGWAIRCVVLARVAMFRQRRNGSFGSGSCVCALLLLVSCKRVWFAFSVGVSSGDGVSGSDISVSLVVPIASVGLWSLRSICIDGAQDTAQATLHDSPCPVGLRLQFYVFAE